MFLLVSIAAFARPAPLVAVGGELVAGAPEVPVPASHDAAVPGGWVSVVGDCLEERMPGRFTVIDRTTRGATVATVSRHLDEVRALEPAVVLVGLGARDLSVEAPDVAAFQAGLVRLVDALRGPPVILVGVVPRTAKRRADDPVDLGNAAIASVAEAHPGVTFADPRAGWPQDAETHATLVLPDGHLTDLGHARVGAAVCDAVARAVAPAEAEPAP